MSSRFTVPPRRGVDCALAGEAMMAADPSRQGRAAWTQRSVDAAERERCRGAGRVADPAEAGRGNPTHTPTRAANGGESARRSRKDDETGLRWDDGRAAGVGSNGQEGSG